MNNIELQAFADELLKEGRLMPIVRLKGVAKRFFSKRKAAKNIYKSVSNEAANLAKINPDFDTKRFMKERMPQVQRQAAETAAAKEKAIFEGPAKVKGGWVGKYKYPLILGGVAAGGLYAANKLNTKSQEEKQRKAAMRNFNIPQRVMYQ